MNFQRKWIALLATALLAACSSASDGGPESPTPDNDSAETTTVRGSLSSDASAQSGSSAELFVIGDNGELTSHATTEIRAEGDYEFELDLTEELEGEKTLMVRAYDGSEARVGSVVAERILVESESVLMAPIDTETDVEAKFTVDIRASGECDSCSVESIRSFVSSELAASLATSEELTAEARAAFVAQMNARDEILSAESETEARTEIETSIATALSARDEELAEANSEEERQAAIRTFEEARVAAYMQSTIDADVLARSFQAGAAAAEASASAESEINGQAQAVWQRAEMDASLFLRAFVESGESVSEESSQRIADAGAELETSLRAAFESSADASADVEAAWSEYSTTIREEMSAELEASVYAAIQGLQATFDSARGEYEQAIESGQSAAEAQAQLFASVQAESHLEALSAAGMTQAEAAAHLEVLAHLMVESSLPELPDLETI